MERIPEGTPYFHWSLWFGWVVFTVLGGALGFIVTLGWIYGLWRYFHVEVDNGSQPSVYVVYALTTMLNWAVVGTSQWLFLRRVLPKTVWWIPATALGGALYWILFLGTWNVVRDQIYLLSTANLMALGLLTLFGAVAGLSLGFAQRWTLARQIPHAVWWIVGSAAGWAVALAVGGAGSLLAMTSLDLLNGLDPIGPRTLIFAIYAAITGITLVIMLKLGRPITTAQRPSVPGLPTAIASLLLGGLLIVYAIWTLAPTWNVDPMTLWARPPVYPNLKLNVYTTEFPLEDPGRDPGEVTTRTLYSETDDPPQSVLTFYSDAFRGAGWEPRSASPDANTVRFVKFVDDGTAGPQTYTFEVAAFDYTPYGTSVHIKLGVIKGH